jgi:hypothetical protein
MKNPNRFYEGRVPIVVTTDLEIITQVFNKQYFNNFSARKVFFKKNNNKICKKLVKKIFWSTALSYSIVR